MRILLVEDDRRLAESVKFQFEKEGFAVDLCEAGDDGLQFAAEGVYDAILLDRMLPGMDGIEVLKELRKRRVLTPVILLTALGGLEDKITGLDSGADDYIVKPFAFGELLARVRSVCRRPPFWEQSELLSCGDLKFSPAEKRLCGPAGSCELSRREADLMEAFLKNPSQTLPRGTLLLRVYGDLKRKWRTAIWIIMFIFFAAACKV